MKPTPQVRPIAFHSKMSPHAHRYLTHIPVDSLPQCPQGGLCWEPEQLWPSHLQVPRHTSDKAWHTHHALCRLQSETTSGAMEARFLAPPQVLLPADTADAEVSSLLAAAGLVLPVLAKPLLSDGAGGSHSLAVVHSSEGLRSLVCGVPDLLPPLLLQQYVPHGSQLFKVSPSLRMIDDTFLGLQQGTCRT